MAVSNIYYEIIGVRPGADRDTVKRAYHRIVRAHHPDLFPECLREIQELKMVQINDAYARIMKNGDFSTSGLEAYAGVNGTLHDALVRNASPALDKTLGFHHDIEYAYYKQGFINFSKALAGIKLVEPKAALRNDLYYIRRFSTALFYLRRADIYFSELVRRFPASMWARDARLKIRRSEYFNRLYLKILRNIEQRLRERFSEEQWQHARSQKS